jgi:predicted hydrocarbon binding protein
MPQTIDLAGHGLVALSRTSLTALRAALLRDAGPAAAAYLQEAGYAGGETIFASFRTWLRNHGGGEPEELGLEDFERHASEYFRDAGWGALRIGSLGEAVATLDSEDWAEADPAVRLDHPGCHLTTGIFADFFGRVADVPLAVLEVECRSMGSYRCRFLLGNSEVMTHIYEQMGKGVGYEEAVEGIE